MLTFIFTVVSDFALVPSLTVTAKNRKHFEVFVGTSAILTVRKKKRFFALLGHIVPIVKIVLKFFYVTRIHIALLVNVEFFHVTRSPKKIRGFCTTLATR